jgi:hypothetical protein
MEMTNDQLEWFLIAFDFLLPWAFNIARAYVHLDTPEKP